MRFLDAEGFVSFFRTSRSVSDRQGHIAEIEGIACEEPKYVPTNESKKVFTFGPFRRTGSQMLSESARLAEQLM